MAQKTILIVGGGKFGKKAVEFAKNSKYNIIIIDKNPECYTKQFADIIIENNTELKQHINKLEEGKILFFQGDIIENISLLDLLNPKFVIPVVPIHFIAVLILHYLNRESIKVNRDKSKVRQIAPKIKPGILLDSVESKGVIYLSYAKKNETCPENCTAPRDFCPNFEREKPITITNYLKKFFKSENTFFFNKKAKKIVFIIESEQLRGGLGGIPGSLIQFILKELKTNKVWMKENNFELIVATTCNCHGVVNFYRKK
ncbi:MAG: hypothetical protein ACOC44_02320 [Promethearchaeia archaeon]